MVHIIWQGVIRRRCRAHCFIMMLAAFFCILAFSKHRVSAASTPLVGRMEGGYYTIQITPEQGRKGIQKALNEAHTNANAGHPYKIILTPGVYDLTGGLHIYSNTYLYAQGSTLLNNRSNTGNMLKIGGNSTDMVRGYGYKNITVDGGIWNGNGISHVLFKLGHAKNVIIRNATIQNNLNAHLMEVAAVNGLYISNCIFRDQKRTSNYDYTNEAIQLDILQKNHMSGYYYIDEDMDVLNRNITIDRCSLINCTRGIGAHTAVNGRYFWNIRITNNVMTGISEVGISCRNFRKCVISGNTITAKDSAVEIGNMGGAGVGAFLSRKYPAVSRKVHIPRCNITLTGNRFTSTGYHSTISLKGLKFTRRIKSRVRTATGWVNSDTIPKGDYYVNGVSIRNNSITGKGRFTVRVAFSKNVSIKNNVINAAGHKAGISCYNGGAGSIDITYNKITGSPLRGIDIHTKSSARKTMGSSVVGTIKGNVIANVRGSGIYLSGSRVRKVERNRISGTSCLAGVYAKGSKVTSISRNKISGIKRRGITATAGSKVGKISRNDIRNTRAAAIAVNKDSKVRYITRNRISGAGAHAINIQTGTGYTISVSRNKIAGDRKYTGIYVGSGRVNATKNTLKYFGIGIRYTKDGKGKYKGNKFVKCRTKVKKYVEKKKDDKDRDKDKKKDK